MTAKLYQRIRIRKYERGLMSRDGEFTALLGPGVYRLFHLPGQVNRRIDVRDISQPRFTHAMLDTLVTEPAMREALRVVDLAADQRALVWVDKRLAHVLGPGLHAFWKDSPHDVQVEVFDIAEPRLDHPKVETVLQHPDASKYLTGVHVDQTDHALLFVDGRYTARLEPGLHVYWTHGKRVAFRTADLREQVADVAGQEILTADKVTLRVNLVVSYQVTDAVRALTVVTDYDQALYREAQLALRSVVGGRKLDTLLADKQAIGEEVADLLTKRVEQFGVTVRAVGLRDIILPGEMKEILNQVIAAEKRAQADLIRRREETAAARSQANTARLIADNPVLARMKELEALGEILKGMKATFVLGGGDLSDQVHKLVRTADTGDDDEH